MRLDIVCGHSGSGKTAHILDRIEALSGEPCLLIVPESVTFDYEQALSQRLGGLFGTQVLGFSRLSTRVMEQVGGRTRAFLSEEGKRMVLRMLINRCAGELEMYAKASPHSGFAQKLAEIIALLKQDFVTSEQLVQIASTCKDTLLKGKLQDIYTIYKQFEAFTDGRFIDIIDSQALFVQKLGEASLLSGSHVFIDCISAFSYSRMTYAAVDVLIQNCASVTVSIRRSESSESHMKLFEQDEKVRYRLEQRASELGAQVGQTYLYSQLPRPPAVRSIERYLFSELGGPCNPSGLTLYDAPTPAMEVESAAQHIISLLSGGASCRDIVVAIGDDNLSPILARALEARSLPYFLDKPRPLATHSVVEGLLCAIGCVQGGFARQDVLRVAKSGFNLLDDEQAEIFCDYTLRYGINYGFKKPFVKGQSYHGFEQAQRARALLVEPLVKLEEELKGATTGFECARALFGYMQSIGLGEKLERTCEELKTAGQYGLAAQNAQVYNTLLSLLDQMALLIGTLAQGEFQSVLEEGLLACEIGLIPPQNDYLLICDIAKAASRDSEHLLVLGANEGSILPLPPEGILNDGEIAQLEAMGVEAFNCSELEALKAKNTAYSCLSRAQKSLYVSCSLCDMQAKAQQSSMIMDRLHTMFPMAAKPSHAEFDSERMGFSRLVGSLRELALTGDEPEGLAARFWGYMGIEGYSGALKQAVTLMLSSDGGLDESLAKRLTEGWEKTSVSRLERFNNCPFAHLVRYGIRPEEIREYKLQALDEGNFYHAVFDGFFKRMSEQGQNPCELEEDEIDRIIGDICDEQLALQSEGLMLSDERHKVLAARLKDCAKRTMRAVIRQLAAGEFMPIGAEVELGELGTNAVIQAGGAGLTLMGRIDRIDRYENYVRIIDYKTGDQKFDLSELFDGTRLQLPLYLAACRDLGQGAGMFYLHVHDPINEEGEGYDEQKQYRLSGFIVDDPAVVRAMDKNGEGFSNIIPVRFTKDGLSGPAVIPREAMDMLTGYACAKAGITASEIMAGHNTPAPVKRGERSVCDYCLYRSICRYEGQKKGFRGEEKIRSVAEFVNAIGEKEGDG